MMVNLLDDTNFHRQTAVMTRLIKELATAMPYGCNDNIKGVGNLSSPGCNEINVMSHFNTIPRTKRSHGHKRQLSIGAVRCTKNRTVCMMVNLLDDSNFHRQTAVVTRLIEMIIQNPVFGIFCIISMLAQ
jgi:hypothetical protein